ncbi:putative MFS transporter, AGZA family, xanthine/uracil permease [Halogranum rubrum]|uniref:Putative MFS transporter, AGZA family, xanthine/uracil permease n=1 Tax=Halogranum rubrum TaxID=553466 RepID=A0A1I4G7H3_9EURY|nr:NCS2 family permease [Halogranum rubrum]SFL25046.1 putative MFS transporter, AGZA family, xanthine/uracil permease [Halogranum rubrum]
MGVREFFDLDAHGTDLRTEALAGLTTFLTMSYIVVVNPAILAAVSGENGKPGIAVAGTSTAEVVQMLAVVTILAAATGTLVMALYANLPFGQAPGMGLNAFFAFTVVGALGVPWETALAAVVVEGVLFILLTAIGARKYVIRLFPEPVKFAVGSGIGLFLAIIGLQEMRLVVADPATLVTLGDVAADPVAMLSVVGLFFTFGLYARGIRGSIVVGILTTTLLGIIATYLSFVDSGVLAIDAVKQGAIVLSELPSATYDITPLAGAFVGGLDRVEPVTFALVVFMLFFVDFFNTAGALVGVGQVGDFLDDDGNFPDVDKPLMADAVGTTVGGMLGTSTVTTYIESATGVEEGGRTGLTALVIALLFLAALAVVPLAAAIPLYASHIAVVVIGVVMLQNVVDIDWHDITHAIPAGLTILVMPFTYSIAYGIAAGIVAFPLVKVAAGDYENLRVGHLALAGAFVVYFVVRTGGLLG